MTASASNQNRSTTVLIEEVGQWATKNFGTVEMGRRIPHWGLQEEIGEAAHCILKHTQKIRGYEKVDFFRSELKDAFADTIIYLADYCYLHCAYFRFDNDLAEVEKSVQHLREKNEELVVGRVIATIASIFNYESASAGSYEGNIPTYCLMAQQLVSSIQIWAAYWDFNLEEIVWETWAEVGRRDWIKYQSKGAK